MKKHLFFWIIMLVSVAGAVVYTRRPSYQDDCVWPFFIAIFGGFFAGMIAANTLIKRIPKDSLFHNDFRVRGVFKGNIDVWFWQYSKLLKEGSFLSFGETVSNSQIQIQLITDNPEVRALVIKACLVFGGTPQAAITLEQSLQRENLRKLDAEGTREAVGKYLLYELAENSSRELGRFFNPESPRQQEEFRKVVAPYLMERSREWGARVAWTKFAFA